MWAKVDDGWWKHRKSMLLSMAARGLWVTALSYCGDQRSPEVPEGLVRMVCNGDHEDLVAELVDVGLWDEADDGWEVHDWDEYQANADKAGAGKIGGLTRALRDAEKRAEDAEKALESAQTSKQGASNGQAEPKQDQADGKQESSITSSMDPDPVPEPVTQDQPLGAPADAGDAEDDGNQRRAALFEALVEVSGWDMDNLTKSARGRTNRAAKELDDIGASPEGVRARAEVHRVKWPDLDVTPNSIATNYQMLDGKALRDKATGQVRTIDTTPTCVHCQQAVDAHDDGMCDNGRAEAA